MMRQVMHDIDGGLGTMRQRDTTFAAAADSVSRHLTVWLEGDTPRKLIVVDSAVVGENTSETDVWFMGGDVAVLLQAADAYAFDADRIVLWTDESLQPRADVTVPRLMAKETELIAAVHGWLAALGIPNP